MCKTDRLHVEGYTLPCTLFLSTLQQSGLVAVLLVLLDHYCAFGRSRSWSSDYFRSISGDTCVTVRKFFSCAQKYFIGRFILEMDYFMRVR